MSTKILSVRDFSLIPVLGFRVENLAADPAPGNAGRLIINTATGLLKYDNGSAIIDPANRANHSGSQLASTISNFAATAQSYALSSFAAPAANIPMAGYQLTGLGAPSAAGNAVEYSWVIGQIQSSAAGISSKDPVAAVATANIALSGLLTIDGVTLTAGQRVLVVGQTTATQNGIYIASAGGWSRPTSTEGTTYEMDTGAMWLVTGGTTYTGAQFRMSTTGTIVVGTTPISIVQFSAGGSYTAGTNGGLALTAGAFSVLLQTGSWLTTTSSGLGVDQTKVAGKLAQTITGDGTTTVFSVTHALAGGLDVIAQLVEVSTGSMVDVDVTRTTATTVTFGFAVAPTSGKAYRAVLMG